MTWTGSPSYFLRRWTVLREIDHIAPGRLLEIGCGAGDLLAHLVARGFEGTCVELSATAREEAARRLEDARPAVAIETDLGRVQGNFHLVVACEVLEHVEEDRAALAEWAARVAPGGRLLITVPAHPRRFGASDLWAGHFRRYSRTELEEKVTAAGLIVERSICYGFPLGNLIEPIRNAVNRVRLRRDDRSSRRERTLRSGVDRSVESRLGFLARPELVAPFCYLQRPFYGTELGTGLLLLARRDRGG